MVDGPLFTISATDLKSYLEQFRAIYNDGLAIVNAVEAALMTPPPKPGLVILVPGAPGGKDKNGDVWSLRVDTAILVNGKVAYNNWQSQKLVIDSSGDVYILGLDGNGYKWNGKDFLKASLPVGA